MSARDFLLLPFTPEITVPDEMVDELTEKIVGYAIRSALAAGLDASDCLLALINAAAQGGASAFLHGYKKRGDAGPFSSAIAATAGARTLYEIQRLNLIPPPEATQ